MFCREGVDSIRCVLPVGQFEDRVTKITRAPLEVARLNCSRLEATQCTAPQLCEPRAILSCQDVRQPSGDRYDPKSPGVNDRSITFHSSYLSIGNIL